MAFDIGPILCVNAGSSSLKLELVSSSLDQVVKTEVTNVGKANACLISVIGGRTTSENLAAKDCSEAFDHCLMKIGDVFDLAGVGAIGHRIVHGGNNNTKPSVLTELVIKDLEKWSSVDPEHMKSSLEIIAKSEKKFLKAVQVACFDTSFFTEMPDVAKTISIPRKFASLGIRKYGFHGLSYEYVYSAFKNELGIEISKGRIIMAHLGGGASLAAIKNCSVVDTSMSFTPSSGVPSGTRAGDLDPAIVGFLVQAANMSLEEVNQMLYYQSGLLGISGISADMKDLLAKSKDSKSAQLAIDVFISRIRQSIGGMTATMGGLDSLIFTGGIGENSPVVRSLICDNFSYLGISLDEKLNGENAFIISSKESEIGVYVIQTNEASIIAKQTIEASMTYKETTNGDKTTFI